MALDLTRRLIIAADLFSQEITSTIKRREGNTSYNEFGINNYMYQLISLLLPDQSTPEHLLLKNMLAVCLSGST